MRIEASVNSDSFDVKDFITVFEIQMNSSEEKMNALIKAKCKIIETSVREFLKEKML